MIVLKSDEFGTNAGDTPGFTFKSQNELLADTTALIRQKEQGAMVIYTLLIFVAMISIFDTQVLAVFRRRKEIGLLLALGLTKNFIVGLFTIEGILYGLLAAILGTIAGLPILGWVAKSGITLPQMTEKMGIAASVIYPTFSWQLLCGTFFIVMIILSVVSYLPARSIASMQPTPALRGS